MARDYAVVTPAFWTGTTGRQLRASGRDAQLLALYLVTNPHANMIGLYQLALPTLCHEAGFTIEGASKALRSLGDVGFGFYDEDAEEVWVPSMAHFQVADQKEALKPGDKRCKGVARELAAFSKSRFYRPFLERYASVFHLPFEAAPKAQARGLEGPSIYSPEAPSKALLSQDQDQDHDQEAAAAARASAREAADENRGSSEQQAGPVARAPDTTCQREQPGANRQDAEGSVSAPETHTALQPALDDDLPPRTLVVEDLSGDNGADPVQELQALAREFRLQAERALLPAGWRHIGNLADCEWTELGELVRWAGGPSGALEWFAHKPEAKKVKPLRWFLTILRDEREKREAAKSPASAPRTPAAAPIAVQDERLRQLLEHARQVLRTDLFERWFAPLDGVVNGAVKLQAPDGYHAAFVRENYAGWIAQAAEKLFGQRLEVVVFPEGGATA